MQGQRSAIGSLPDSIDFDYGSTSSNVGIDQQICWNNLRDPAETRLSDYRVLPGAADVYMDAGGQGGQNPGRWSIGESSSSNLQNPINRDDQTAQNGWPLSMGSSIGGSSRLETVASSRTGINLNLNMSQISSGPSFESNLGQLGRVGLEPSASSSGIGRFLVEEVDGRSGFALDGRRLSCKRKTTEGQSSNSMWQAVPPCYTTGSSSLNISPQLEAPVGVGNPNPVNSRLELSMLGVTPGDTTSVSRNFRVRMNPYTQQDTLPSMNVGQSNPPLQLGLRRNIHSIRLNGGLRSRAGNSSTSLVDAPVRQDLNLRPVPRNLPEHPLFNVAHSPAPVARHVGSSPRAVPSWGSALDHPPQHSRGLSEYVRRSLMSAGGSEARALSSSSSSHRSVPSSSQELMLPTSGRTHWMDRHGDGAIGIPYSLRALSAAGEGRSRLVSEIRNVLDMMRRGEGLRFEDMMMLDPSVFFGMADIRDQHRDMRLDVDNMSYEELLALEERIGNVCTGLSAETIAARMKQRKHVSVMKIDQAEVEPCCICQEEYDDGEVLGTLDCGHDFHSGCIKQWLEQKNMCPICKTTALST